MHQKDWTVEQQLNAEENSVEAAEAAEREVQDMWNTDEAGELVDEQMEEEEQEEQAEEDEQTQQDEEQLEEVTLSDLADAITEDTEDKPEVEKHVKDDDADKKTVDRNTSSMVAGVPDGSAGVPFIPSNEGSNKPSFTRRASNSFRSNSLSDSNDVFSRLSSHMTGTHKHGGRRAVANVHSTRLSTSSIYGGGAARGRGWLIQSDPDMPGPQDKNVDPHAHTDLASCARRSHNIRGIGGMATSQRFRQLCTRGGLLSDRDAEEAAHRAPSRTHAELVPGANGVSKESIHMGGASERFTAQLSTGQYRSKRDLKESLHRGSKHQQQAGVYSSFKRSAAKGKKNALFGGSTDRFQVRTASGIVRSKRDLVQPKSTEEAEKKREFTPVYSSFARSAAPSKRSSYFGGSTSRFADGKKKNGGLVTPGPGAFELTASASKGFFGSTTAPISLLA